MSDSTSRGALGEMLAPVRELEPTDEQVARVLRATAPRRRRPQAIVVTTILVLLFGIGFGVPQVRAAIGDVAQAFAGYFQGDGDAIGDRADQGSSPTWLFAGERSGQVQLADSPGDEHDLYMVVEPSGSIGFALGDSFAVSDTVESWSRQFEGHSLQLLGADDRPNPRQMVSLFGVTARSVTAVEVSYKSGPPSPATLGEGGFVVSVEVNRGPLQIAARDDAGVVLEKTSIDSYYPWQARGGDQSGRPSNGSAAPQGKSAPQR